MNSSLIYHVKQTLAQYGKTCNQLILDEKQLLSNLNLFKQAIARQIDPRTSAIPHHICSNLMHEFDEYADLFNQIMKICIKNEMQINLLNEFKNKSDERR